MPQKKRTIIKLRLRNCLLKISLPIKSYKGRCCLL